MRIELGKNVATGETMFFDTAARQPVMVLVGLRQRAFSFLAERVMSVVPGAIAVISLESTGDLTGDDAIRMRKAVPLAYSPPPTPLVIIADEGVNMRHIADCLDDGLDVVLYFGQEVIYQAGKVRCELAV